MLFTSWTSANFLVTFLQNVVVSVNKQFKSFQNLFDILSQLCQGNGYKAISHFKCLREDQNSVPRAVHATHQLWVDQASLRDIRTSTISRSYTPYFKVRSSRRSAGYGQRHHLLSIPTTEPRGANETDVAIKLLAPAISTCLNVQQVCTNPRRKSHQMQTAAP
jgi:hypothetical protein